MELLPGARFRIPVQNPGSESRRSLGQRLGGEISWFPDHPGGPQFVWGLGPGISALEPPGP